MTKLVKKFATLILLGAIACVPALAQAGPRGVAQARKLNKRQAKAIKRYAKAQRKAQRKSVLRDRKMTRQANKPR